MDRSWKASIMPPSFANVLDHLCSCTKQKWFWLSIAIMPHETYHVSFSKTIVLPRLLRQSRAWLVNIWKIGSHSIIGQQYICLVALRLPWRRSAKTWAMLWNLKHSMKHILPDIKLYVNQISWDGNSIEDFSSEAGITFQDKIYQF